MTNFTKKRITAEVIEETANYVERQLKFATDSFNNYGNDSELSEWELQSKAETKARVDAYEKLLTALEKI